MLGALCYSRVQLRLWVKMAFFVTAHYTYTIDLQMSKKSHQMSKIFEGACTTTRPPPTPLSPSSGSATAFTHTRGFPLGHSNFIHTPSMEGNLGHRKVSMVPGLSTVLCAKNVIKLSCLMGWQKFEPLACKLHRYQQQENRLSRHGVICPLWAVG